MFESFSKKLALLSKHRWLIYGVCAIICSLFLYRISKISPKSDLLELLPQDDEVVEEHRYALKHFNPLELIYFDIHSSEGQSTAEISQVSDKLAGELERSNLFSKIFYKINTLEIQKTLQTLRDHHPVYFSKDSAKDLEEKIKKESIARSIKNWKNLFYESPAPTLIKAFFLDPIGMDHKIYQIAQSLYSEGNEITTKNGRLVSRDLTHTFIIATPKLPASNADYSDRVTKLIDRTIQSYETKDIKISYVSSHRFAALNESIMKRDIRFVSILSIIGILLLCFLCFKKRFLPIFLLIPMSFGLIVSTGFLTFLFDKISLITIGCGSILFGIVIDYGIHIIYHIDQDGSFKSESIQRVIKSLLKPLTISTLTTIIAFSCLYFSKFESYKQFAVFSGLGVFSAYIFTVIIFPTFFSGIKSTDRKPTISFQRFYTAIFKFIDNQRIKTILAIFSVSILAVFGVKELEYQSDLNELYASSEKIQEDRDQLSKSFKSAMTSSSMVVRAPTLDEALSKNVKLKKILTKHQKQGIIDSIKSTALLIPPLEIQKENLSRWNQFTVQNRGKFIQDFFDVTRRFKISSEQFSPFISRFSNNSNFLRPKDFKSTSLGQLLSKHIKITKEDAMILTGFQLKKDSDFLLLKNEVKKVLPETMAINSRYFLSYIMDLIPNELMRLSSAGLVAVGLLLMLAYGPSRIIQLLAPIGISILWTLGALGWLQIKINIMNCVVILFMFGLVSDYSVFLNQAFRSRPEGDFKSITTSCGAITISVLTTIIGIGALSLSQHPIFQSVGATTLIGMVCGYVAVVIIVPLIAGTNFENRSYRNP